MSPILSYGAVGIIIADKMILVIVPHKLRKLVDFFIKFSEKYNLIIILGLKTDGLYTTTLLSHHCGANISVNTSHLTYLQEMV